MIFPRAQPLRFTRGRHAYVVARAYDGDGYIGVRDGRIVTRGLERARVTRALIMECNDGAR
jgi:hypothetical protein